MAKQPDDPKVVLVQPDTFVGYSMPTERIDCLGKGQCPSLGAKPCKWCIRREGC